MTIDVARTALLLLDLQNDFMHPEGAYARGGATAAEIAALPDRLAPLVQAARVVGVLIVSTHFTLVPGRGGVPFISPHLAARRPFLGAGDFAPGSFGQALIDPLAPADIEVEKVAFSAFYMSRLDWVLRRASIAHLVAAGIVTDGGVTSTLRDAHVRDYELTVLADGCAAFTPAIHETAMDGLSRIAEVTTVCKAAAAFAAA